MKKIAGLPTKYYVIGGAVGVVGFALWYFWDSLANINKGTPYEGAGAVGTLGNVTNQLLGGAPATIGSAIGTTLYDWTHDDEDALSDTYLFTIQGTTTRGAVNANEVGPTGIFVRRADGKTYTLKRDDKGNRIAVPLQRPLK